MQRFSSSVLSCRASETLISPHKFHKFHKFSFDLLQKYTKLNHFYQILSYAISSGHFKKPLTSSKLLYHSLAFYNSLNFSSSIFFQIKNPNVFAWNFMLRAYSQSSTPDEAIYLYNVRRINGDLPDKYTFPFVLKACGRLLNIRKGQEVHCLSKILGLEDDVFVQNALIWMYSQCGFVDIARKVFDIVPKLVRDVVTWNSMMSGYLLTDSWVNALYVFKEMLKENSLQPNGVTFASALTACSRSGFINLGRKIHGVSVCWGFIVDVYVASSLVDMYAKCGALDDARKVFERIGDRNVVSWTTMIAGYVQSHLFKEAIELFKEMLRFGCRADSPTVACVVSACGHLGVLDEGRWIHMYCERNGIEMNLKVYNALIDMYSKCGDIEKALEIFYGLTCRDAFSWSVMISGLAMNGKSDEALQLFLQMEKCADVRPNGVILLGVLSACSHGGHVDEGFYYLDAMTWIYNVEPAIEHYGCMVDLLGRANLLVEAVNFISSLPIKPDAAMWRSLLFACRSHGNIKVAEFAANKIQELEPGGCGSHILLSNVYASASMWSDVKMVRKSMSFQGIQKTPGCSFIEISGTVHEFYVADESHHQNEEIFETVRGLSQVIESNTFELDILHS